MAEIEAAGMKIKGGKILLILPILGTLAGGLWGGFEFYKDYMNMREKIESYEAPDLSGFDKKLAVLEQEIHGVIKEVHAEVKVIQADFKILQGEMAAVHNYEETIKQSADDARDYTKEVKREVKNEMHHMEGQIESIEKRGKEAFRLVRSSIETNDAKVRKMITDNSERFDSRREQLRNDMDSLEIRIKSQMKDLQDTINDKIKKALENPLAGMRKN